MRDDFNKEKSRPMHGGDQLIWDFPNGYSASVIRHQYSYGHEKGLWELAVMRDDTLVYDTPVADDVIGNLSEDEVDKLLIDIANLPAPTVSEQK